MGYDPSIQKLFSGEAGGKQADKFRMHLKAREKTAQIQPRFNAEKGTSFRSVSASVSCPGPRHPISLCPCYCAVKSVH